MDGRLTGAEAFFAITETLASRLQQAFKNWDIKISFSSHQELCQQAGQREQMTVIPLGWEDRRPSHSSIGTQLTLFYGIMLTKSVEDSSWETIAPIAKVPFQIHELMRRPFPKEVCPGVIFQQITDKVLADTRSITADGLFWSLLEVSFQVEIP